MRMKKYLLLGIIGTVLMANGKDPLPIQNSGTVVAKQNEVVNVPTSTYEESVVIGKAKNAGKYVNKKYSSVEAGIKATQTKTSTKAVVKEDNLDTNYLLQKRASIQKSLNSREMSLSDKKLLSGKKEAIRRVSTSFEYYNDSIYEVFSTPDFMTIIKFNPDEQILHVAGGDPENWNIEQTQGGEGNSTYLYLMPVDTDLVTNLSVITTKRAYVFTLYSTDYTYNPLVRFTYPLDKTTMGYDVKKVGQVIEPTVINNVVKPSGVESSELSGVKVNTLDDLDFDYLVSKGDYAFTPTKVYSDLKQTVIEFKDTLVEAPVLFVKGLSGDYEVVNYKHTGNRILVDRKIDKAALKLGNQTVYIKHK